MVRKIGSFWLILLLMGISSINAKPSLTFSITDLQDKKLEWAGVGVPFLLTVIVRGEQQVTGQPEISGLDDFHVRSGGTSTNYYMVNNKTTAVGQYKYIVRIDKVGNYQIGPVKMQTPEGSIRAAARTLTVKDEPQEISQKEVSDAFLRMSIEPERGYLGQKFLLKIRFYATGDAMIMRLFKPELSDFWVGQFKESTAGLEEVNGLDYQFIEYEAAIVPKKTGDLPIESMEAEYQIPAERRSGLGFFSMFASDVEFRRTLSNALVLPISPLPDHDDGDVNGVGQFSSFSATVDHTDAKTGQGILYTLMLEGDADLERIEAPQLHVPEMVTYYDSKSIIEPGNVDHGPRKIFEYIIQAQEAGDIIIPSQKFVYFDPIQELYKTVSTQPIGLHITQAEQEVDQSYEEKTYDTISYDEPTDNLFPLNEHGPWMPVRYRSIPFGIFIFLLFLPLLLGLAIWIVSFYRWYYDKNATYFAYKSAFRKAKNSLAACQDRHGAAGLYDLFIRLIAARSHLVPSSVNNEYVRGYLHDKLSEEQMDAWSRFFKAIQEIRFYGKTPDVKIYEAAQEWLELFEKVL